MYVVKMTEGKKCNDMEEFDLDSEYEKVIRLLNSDEFSKLKEKVEKKEANQKDFKIYLRLNKVKENIDYLNNIIKYIKDIQQEIINMQKEKETRKIFREIQRKENCLINQIKSEEIKIKELKNKILSEDFDEEEKDFIKEQINTSLHEIDKMKKELEEIEKYKSEIEKIDRKYPFSYEEQKEIIDELRGKILQYSVVAEKLIRGHTFDEALEYLMNWQKERYKLDKKDIKTIKKDIEKIKNDQEIANEIVNTAYYYDEKIEEYR